MIILFIFVGNESGGIVLMVRKCKLNLFINGIKYINKCIKCFYRSDCVLLKVIIKYFILFSLVWNMKINKLNVLFFLKSKNL